MKIAIVTAAWKRPEILDLWCWYWSRLRDTIQTEGHELVLICACSEVESAEICRKYGVEVITVENDPLYLKWNAVAQVGKAHDVDACLFLGSDDLVNATLLRYYFVSIKDTGASYMAPMDWHFWDTRSRQLAYWGGYREPGRKGEPCGAGRLMTRDLLDRISWKPWIPGYDRVLDTGFSKQLKMVHHSTHFFMISDIPWAMGLDIKGAVNMTPFRLWDNTEVITGGLRMLEDCFSTELSARIASLEMPPPELKSSPVSERDKMRAIKLKRMRNRK